MLPEAVAYAGIAGLPPSRAIIAAIVGGIGYALMGRSRFAIVTPTSSSAAILAAALASLALPADQKSAVATLMVGLVGIGFLIMAAFRLGAISAFISRPVLRGFALGLAITIIVKQLPTLVGLPVHAASIGGVLVELVHQADRIHLPSMAIGIGALALLLCLRWQTKLPAALIVLLIGISASAVLNLKAAGIEMTGGIMLTDSMPTLALPPIEQIGRIVQLVLPLTLILFAESWGTMRSLALRHGDLLEPNRELAALGGANLVSAFSNGMPVGAGFSAGSASEAAGALSRLTGLTASLGLAAIILLAAPLVALIPGPVLAAVVIAALTHALTPQPLIALFRIDRDQWIAISAMVGVIVLGVLNGMLFAIALSLAALLRRFARPVISELGQLGDSHDFVDIARHATAVRPAGILIMRPNAPLFFGNAESALGLIAGRSSQLAKGTAVIVSLEESDDLDSTAIDALTELDRTLAQRGLRLGLARVHDRVRAVLMAAGLSALADQAGFSVADTVNMMTRQSETQDAL
ncbi:MAG: sodium-independent anion transporter [Sphingomonas sp. 28-63-12]|nr:MAG: sodium-independent anion transporter [Sphingomonas sp. 28-63-12]